MNSRDEVKSDPRRSLPAVDRVVRALEGIASGLPVWTLREAAREVLDAERARLGATSGSPAAATEQDLIAAAATRARDLARPHPQSLINATGILLHTNLGRAPLAPGAARAVELAARYERLWYDNAGGGALEDASRTPRTSRRRPRVRPRSPTR